MLLPNFNIQMCSSDLNHPPSNGLVKDFTVVIVSLFVSCLWQTSCNDISVAVVASMREIGIK